MATWSAALRDQTIPIHWLLEVDVAGVTLRYADKEIDLGGWHYGGALTVLSDPRQSVDPYSGAASAASAGLSLAPLEQSGLLRPLARPCDLEDTYGVPLIGMPARLYRWAEGTAESERDLVIDGHIRDPYMDETGALSFTLVDFSERYDRFKLPWYTITTELWSAADSDDQGRKAPIVYGTFTGVEVPNIVGSTDKHIISHHIENATGGRIGDTASTPVDTNSTDSDGTEYCELDYGSDTENQDTTVDGTGYLDDVDGTYTGTASALIANIGGQLHHLAVEVVGIPAAKVDRGAFAFFRTSHEAHVNALVIGADDDTSFFAVAQEALRPYRAACYVERGMLTVRKLVLTAGPVMALREGGVLTGLKSVDWRGYEDTPAGIELKYSRGWVTKKKRWDFRATIKVKASDYPPFALAAEQGSELLEIEAPHVQDADTAELMVATMKELHGKTRRYIEAETTREAHSLMIFDTVEVTATRAPSAAGAGWTDKRFVVVGISYGLDSNSLTLLEV